MKAAPYGTWHSPISAADLARSAVSLSHVQVHSGVPCWVESRPTQSGRYVIVTPGAQGRIVEQTPAGFNVRTRVHEYGGRAYALGPGEIYFSNFTDQRLYIQRANAPPVALTAEGYRYADLELVPSSGCLLAVREDHSAAGEPKNAIVALGTRPSDAGRSKEQILFAGSDFVAYPRASADGRRIAWIAWNHPDMPWDATTLYVADWTPHGLGQVTAIAGGPHESVLEPRWHADGTLYFISDRSGWWNLYRFRRGEVQRVFAIDAELATPLWTLGQSNYALERDRAVLRYGLQAQDRLGVVDLASGVLRPIELPFVGWSSIELLEEGTAIAIAASPVEEPAVVTIDLATGAHRVLRAPSELKVDSRHISVARSLEYPSTQGRTAHAFYYPPSNADFNATAREKPPLVVKAHGGPTSHSKPEFSLGTQYWTSRGFAVLDVNYGGSSGYGRAYLKRLEGNWGIVDVEDVVAGVTFLAESGRVDPERTAIRGGSAGGFTVLAALAFHDVFRAGANYYGVSDLEALARDTHKFESRYLDRLVAPLPEGRAIYRERAPIHHLQAFRAPLITFQGTEDEVVPPSQSRAIVAALQARGVPVEYIEFEGEQHGFRRAESIVRSLEAELDFYGRAFGFTPAGR
ncbi:MAG TPA: S9 family peptidase [Steroidobacteraceae bacterium]|nr:S9 family peptidase [Steroidobacteraceae bacterium]